MVSRFMAIVVLVMSLVFWGNTAFADEVLEAITEAQEAYSEKEYQEAIESLEYARQLIQQMSSEGMMVFLPQPLEGWKAQSGTTQNMGIMGGSAGVQREYTKSGGGRVTISIMGESPIFQGMMAMFNPALAGADGGKLQKIQRNKAIVKYKQDARDGDIMVNVDKRYLVMIEGNDVAREDLMAYAEAVDYKGLKKF
jgi:hypothetical protein